MRRSFLLAFVLAAAANGQRPADLESLVAAELSFAKLSESRGLKEAFLANLAEGAIVFRPRPVEGKPVYAQLAPSPALLTWYPAYAAISAAGDLGYTTGPYRLFAARGEAKPVQEGQYITLWQRQTDGGWKAVLDAGISHPPQAATPPAFDPRRAAQDKARAGAGDPALESAALLELEAALSKAASLRPRGELILEAAVDDGLFLREGAYPAFGKEAARPLLASKKGRISWSPIKAVVSKSGDLGYVYGLASEEDAESSYLRIWKKGAGRWEIALDLATPVPRPEKK